jgi:hypothetical protein
MARGADTLAGVTVPDVLVHLFSHARPVVSSTQEFQGL